MKVLFDEGTPLPLRKFLPGHDVDTVQELGWSSMRDGELLRRAGESYEVFVTTDRNLRHQQNLTGLSIAILVLPTPSWPKLSRYALEIRDALNRIGVGEVREYSPGGPF